MASKVQQEKFNKAVEKEILKLGGTIVRKTPEGRGELSIKTKAGKLSVSLHEPDVSKLFSIFCCFEDPLLANEMLSSANKSNLNSNSGKWNYHYDSADVCLEVFLFSLKEIEAETELAKLYDLRVGFGTGLSMNEAIARAIRDCFLRHDGKLSKALLDETIKAVGKNTPQYKTEWKDFKKTFEIQTKGGEYINPFCI